MDELFRPAAGGSSSEKETTERIDPFLAQRVETRPWELRSAQWRAWALAEMVFGPHVSVSLVGTPGYPAFRGLLNLSVPFRDLSDHEEKQGRFLRWAGDDPVLSRVPLLFIFEPDPVWAP